MENQRNTLSLLALFLVLFIDGLGQGILFPVLTGTLIDSHTAIFATGSSAATREFLYGLVISIFFFCWFLGAAILGDLSDAIGRKKALLICLVGATLAYFISALAFVSASIVLLIAGRMVAGLTAGSQPIAQAAITELSDPEKLARNFGMILLAVSAGIACGPVISGVLIDSQLVSWFNYTVPMYFACLLSIINVVLLFLFFTETAKQYRKINIHFNHAIKIFIAAFQDQAVRQLSVAFFFMQMGFNLYYTYLSEYLSERLVASSFMIGLAMGILGVGLGVGFLIITRFVENLSPKKVVITGYLSMAVFFCLSVVTKNSTVIYASIFIGAASMAVSYTYIITLFSNAVNAARQGWVMGITTALFAFGAGLVSIFLGLMTSVGGVFAPIVIVVVLVLIGIAVIASYKPKAPQSVRTQVSTRTI